MIDIFVSHSPLDKKLAREFVTFLQLGVGFDIKNIRCTSFAPSALG
jgi:hypothetical protein